MLGVHAVQIYFDGHVAGVKAFHVHCHAVGIQLRDGSKARFGEQRHVVGALHADVGYVQRHVDAAARHAGKLVLRRFDDGGNLTLIFGIHVGRERETVHVQGRGSGDGNAQPGHVLAARERGRAVDDVDPEDDGEKEA